MKIDNRLKWTLRIASPVLLTLALYMLYSGALDGFIYSTSGIWVPALIVLLVVPGTVLLTILTWFNSANNVVFAFIFFALSIIGHGPFFGYWSGEHEKEIYKILGVRTNALVTESFYSKGNRMYYEFKINARTYRSFNAQNKQDHQIGDTIKIVYNKCNPDMNQPIELLDN